MNKITLCSLRVSTTKQITDSQKTALWAEIRSRGLKIITIDEYRDNRQKYADHPNLCVFFEDKASGKNTNREGYKWMEGMIAGGWVKAVLVYDVSRLGRSFIKNLEFAQLCQERGVEVFAVKNNCSLDSKEGRMLFNTLSAMAEYQREDIVEKTIAGMERRRNTCRHCNVHRDDHHKSTCSNFEGKPHSGGKRGRTSHRIKRLIPRLNELFALGWSNHKIRESTGLHYKTVVRYRKEFEALMRVD